MNTSRIPSFSVLLLLFVLSGLTAGAQVITNTPVLQRTSQQLAAQYTAMHQLLIRTAADKGWPLILHYRKGRMAYLHGIDERGLPIYITTADNLISAATIGTNTLWPNGPAKLGLTGGTNPNMKGRIAVWDEGEVRPTHVELAGRVVQEDANQGDTILSDHSTHVSGTLIATGVNPEAKGMAFAAQQLQAWDFNNDESEMAKAAAGSNGILVSSHSYADLAGWNFDDTQNEWQFWGNPGDTVDIRFGLYDQDAQIWDSIAYYAPFYSIFKAGGNSRGETGPAVGSTYYRRNSNGQFMSAGPRPTGISSNAGYETIATYGNSKNIIALGAVNPIPGGYSQPSDVVLAGFSSLGPTGDGRIKPDLVADGVDVLSSISTADNAYDIYSGTSMATPAAAGSSFLLQEYYSRLHGGNFLHSATIRGLLIHTADEAGSSPGPDYAFGWGLIDMQAAAGVITSDNTDHSQTITESSLTNGTKDSETFTVTASGKTPVKATICWTDPPAAPAIIPNNEKNFQDTTRKLVNDLDLRITDNTTGKVYMPWILDPRNPGNPATKGDNIRDNVEKVELNDSLIPGRTYTITVTHKGSLKNNTQAYSLMVSGVGGTSTCTSASTANGASIDQVTLNGVSFSSPLNTCRTYTDNSASPSFPLVPGGTASFSIAHSSCNSTNNTRVISVYIDYNNDGTFEADELAAQSTAGPSGDFIGTITVPTTVTVGAYARMRIIAEETSNPSAVTPCGTYGAGETQDFRVNFTSPVSDVGVTALEYPTSTTCASDSQLVSIHIRNFGLGEQIGVPVTTVISNGGTIIRTLSAMCYDSIPPGGDVVFTYNTTFPTAANTTYTFISTTSLSTDANTANNSDTATITTNPAASTVTGTATVCGANATSVSLHANATGDDLALWYDAGNATAPIAAGNNTTTTDIPSNKTYYLGLNDLNVKGGAPDKNYFTSSQPNFGGAYFRFYGNFVMFTTGVPLTIESAKMYIGHYGTIGLTLGQLASYNNNTGEYFYTPIDTFTLNVYATTPHPDTAQQVDVAAGDNTDTGATFLLNIPVPNPGTYIIIFNCNGYASAFLNANIKYNQYPFTIPGVFSITGNDFRDLGKADSVAFSHQFYYPFYNISLRLDGCPGTQRTAVTATSETAPTIVQQGPDLLTSNAITGNQWYLNDSLLADSTGPSIQPSLPGSYYTMVADATTNCNLISNAIVWTPSSGTGNQRIGLKVFPNPDYGWFNVSFYMTNTADLSLELFDMVGQKVYEEDHPGFTGAFNENISTSLASGVYVMKIIHGTDTYDFKIVVRHQSP